jgi:hypothetical protein
VLLAFLVNGLLVSVQRRGASSWVS